MEVLRTELSEQSGHRVRADMTLEPCDRAIPAGGGPLLPHLGRARSEKTVSGRLLGPDCEAEVALSREQWQHRRTQCGCPCRARVLDVEHRDSGLADLLLKRLPDLT